MGKSDAEPSECSGSDEVQLKDLRMQIDDLRDFLQLHLTRHTNILESLKERCFDNMETSLEKNFDQPDGQLFTKDALDPGETHIGTPDENAVTDPEGGRNSIVENTLFHLKAKARMQSIKLRAGRRNVAQTQAEKKSCVHSAVHDLISSSLFSATITSLILVNVVLLGVEVDIYAALDVEQQVPGWFDTANAILVMVFLLESILKIYALGCREFWRGSDASWNVLDFVVVVVSVIDLVLQLVLSSAMEAGSLRLIRAIRIVRAVRGLRVLRFFRYIAAFRTLALSIISTMGSLFWTMALLLLMFYFFSTILCQLVADNCRFLKLDGDIRGTGPVCQESLPRYFSSVPESMLTLFMAITNGISWDECVKPLRQVSYMAVVLLIAYVAIAVLAILNVVTGVFCNVAIESAHADKEVATIKQVNTKDQQVNRLRSIFRDIAGFSGNEVSFEDVQEAVSSGELSSFMESMGISTDDIWTLCLLLDSDRNGSIDLEEFVTGCMQLHGPAKSLQLAKMSFENKLTRRAIKQLAEEINRLKTSLLRRGGSSQPPARETF